MLTTGEEELELVMPGKFGALLDHFRPTACSTVMGSIKHLAPVSLCEKLTIKRRFKTSQEGNIKLVACNYRGNKPDIELLENKWHKPSDVS